MANLRQQDLRAFLAERGITIGPKEWPGGPPRQPGRFQALFDPFQAAPVYAPCGRGVLYFGDADRAAFDRYTGLLDVTAGFSDGYAAFVSTLHGAERHRDRRYLAQLLAVSVEALEQQYGIRGLRGEWGRPLPPVRQPVGVIEALWLFVTHQRAYWGTSFTDPQAPAGALGGDGEYEREQLGFGLMSEAPGAVRIWSRAWLVER